MMYICMCIHIYVCTLSTPPSVVDKHGICVCSDIDPNLLAFELNRSNAWYLPFLQAAVRPPRYGDDVAAPGICLFLQATVAAGQFSGFILVWGIFNWHCYYLSSPP